jgi:hypothetical protein
MSAPPKRGDLIWFNATGLGGSNETSARGWRMRTLSALMAENNHSNVRLFDCFTVGQFGYTFALSTLDLTHLCFYWFSPLQICVWFFPYRQ